jgi:hypothetical protein
VIVLAISPGIRTMAWAVLRFDRREIRAECLGFNLEHHGNKRFTVSSFEDMIGRSQVHWLIVSVLLNRYSPGILAMGEQADPKEPKEQAEAARCLLRTIFLHVGIPVIEFDGGRDAVLKLLGASTRQVTAQVENLLGRIPAKAKDSRIKGAMLTGAAAARGLFELPVGQPVSRETGNAQGVTEDGNPDAVDLVGADGRVLAAQSGRAGDRDVRQGTASTPGRRSGAGQQPGKRSAADRAAGPERSPGGTRARARGAHDRS